MQLDIREMDHDWAELCLDSAYKYGVSIYDSSHFTLAQKLSLKLVTADDKLARKVPTANLVTLRDYSLGAI